jgi:hypothetical protein
VGGREQRGERRLWEGGGGSEAMRGKRGERKLWEGGSGGSKEAREAYVRGIDGPAVPEVVTRKPARARRYVEALE